MDGYIPVDSLAIEVSSRAFRVVRFAFEVCTELWSSSTFLLKPPNFLSAPTAEILGDIVRIAIGTFGMRYGRAILRLELFL
jgi:hypothetical protein